MIKSAQELYGKSEGFECAVCHEGNPGAKIKDDAHKGMFPNPSSMWVLHKGKGCAKCHDTKDSITTLMGKPLKDPVGGELMDPVYPSEISKYSRRDYTYRMARSLMSLETGKANKILSSNGVILKGTFPYANFDMDDPDGPVPTVGTDKYKEWVAKAIKSGFLKRLESVKEIPDFESGTEIFGDAEKAGFSDIHRKQCARCHVWGEGREKRGDLRAAGCASCHMLYGNDGKYEGGDRTISGNKSRPHPLRHQITNAIPAAQCTHCHTRGKRIGTSFVGMFEYDYERDGKAPPFDEHGKAQEPLYTKEYLHVREDVHFERGMDCADCHTSIDVHGDGNIYPATYYQVEVSCHDCHGTPDKYPWELPVGYGTPVQLGGERGIYKVAGDKSYLLTSRGNIKPNWRREENKAYVLSRYAGKKREIPLLKSIKSAHRFKTKQGKVAMSVVTRHMQKMECYACHSVWAPQCFGCHIQYDRRAKGTDWPNTSKNLDPVSGRQTITKSPGDLTVENRSFMRWENPILGINVKGKVSPLVPGCQVFYTFIDEKGEIKTSNKTYTTSTGHNSPTLAPLAPHSTTLAARTCEDCHTNPKAIGYGTGNSRSAQQILGNEPLFQNLSKGVYGDIPGAKTGKQQVPKIEKFPYALDQLITRDGKQIQNMPLPEDRPLDNQERNLVEREGLCIGCHQFYGTPEWTELRKKYGRAKTAEQHERIVSEILKSLMKKTK
ncbi:MAG: cytochrome c3 family protein [Armatimonadetes bacterium]|nr:cytochrome c3 family protein [Armatimonadota bacterium]